MAHNIKRPLIEKEVDAAIAELGLPSSVVRKCTDAEAQGIYDTAEGIFALGHPRVWWLALKYPKLRADHYPKSDGYAFLNDYLPPGCDRCWFIPEPDTDPVLVYDASCSCVKDLIGNCYGYEYYLIDPGFRWLIIETDHDVMIYVEAPPAENELI